MDSKHVSNLVDYQNGIEDIIPNMNGGGKAAPDGRFLAPRTRNLAGMPSNSLTKSR